MYPLSLGYGVQGRGGAAYAPPHEALRPPMRTAAGDFFRFACTLTQMSAKCRQLSGLDKAPRHIRAEVDKWTQGGASSAGSTGLGNSGGVLERICTRLRWSTRRYGAAGVTPATPPPSTAGTQTDSPTMTATWCQSLQEKMT